jgi:hypothetical protein
VDVTGDGVREIAFGARKADDATLQIASAANGQILHELATLDGAGIALAAGNLLGDGIDRLVTTTSARGVAIRNLQTGDAEWLSPGVGNANLPFYTQARIARLAQLDGDPALEVVLAGEATNGRFLVFDPALQTVQLQVGFHTSGPFLDRTIVRAELFDFDGDARDDLVVVTEPLYSGSSGVGLEVYSLQNGTRLWAAVIEGEGFSEGRAVMVVPTEFAGDALLVVAVPTGLHAYNARTRSLEWTLAADVRAAAFLPAGLTGPEFALAGADGQLRLYDLATRTLQRSFPAGAVDEIHPMAGGTDVLVKSDGRLRVFSATGSKLGVSDPVGTGGFGTSVLQRTSASGTEILAGTASGYIKFRYLAGHLFGDGFE